MNLTPRWWIRIPGVLALVFMGTSSQWAGAQAGSADPGLDVAPEQYAKDRTAYRVRRREQLSFSQAAHLLTVLTRDTGGQVHFPNSISELDAVYDRIAEELRTQYSMGYISVPGLLSCVSKPLRSERSCWIAMAHGA